MRAARRRSAASPRSPFSSGICRSIRTTSGCSSSRQRDRLGRRSRPRRRPRPCRRRSSSARSPSRKTGGRRRSGRGSAIHCGLLADGQPGMHARAAAGPRCDRTGRRRARLRARASTSGRRPRAASGQTRAVVARPSRSSASSTDSRTVAASSRRRAGRRWSAPRWRSGRRRPRRAAGRSSAARRRPSTVTAAGSAEAPSGLLAQRRDEPELVERRRAQLVDQPADVGDAPGSPGLERSRRQRRAAPRRRASRAHASSCMRDRRRASGRGRRAGRGAAGGAPPRAR